MVCLVFFSLNVMLVSCKKVSAETYGAFASKGSSLVSGSQTSPQGENPQAVGNGGANETPSREQIKLKRVLNSMSARARATMADGDVDEFLADLHRVLEVEESFRSDDLSLYYLIDKKHSVGSDYVPKDLVSLEQNDLFSISRNDLSLRPEAYEALKEMSRASLADGIKLLVSSTYRSYEYQAWLFQHWVEVDGLEEAERESARPGTSQHQLGVAIDFGSISDDFADTKMGKWIYEHSEDYGWSLSFPQGYEDVTGFRWECWHFRYVGKEACAFQRKWFGDVQQFMLEFIDAWKNS